MYVAKEILKFGETHFVLLDSVKGEEGHGQIPLDRRTLNILPP